MDPTELLARYDAEMREDPPVDPGYRLDRFGPIVRMTASEHAFIVYSPLEPPAMSEAVQQQARAMRAGGIELEWKIYSHDRVEPLETLLASAGFEPTPSESLMVRELAQPIPAPAETQHLTVRRIQDEAGLSEAVAVTSGAFDSEDGTLRRHVEGRLDDPSLGLFVAYFDGAPAGAGRVELPVGRSFASLWGGATLPEFRHRGIYRALVAERAAFARDQGFQFVTVDARDLTSRPILERLGFLRLAGIVGWVLRPPPKAPTQGPEPG